MQIIHHSLHTTRKTPKTYTSSYDRVLNTIKKLDTSYNPKIPMMYDPFTEGNYTVTVDTIVIPIV